MRFGRRSTDALLALLAAAVFGLSAASGVSCGAAPEGTESDTELTVKLLSPDTVALVEGRRLLDEERYDLARERLMKSAVSPNAPIRIESYMRLHALETRLENHAAALTWLEMYHVEAMALFRQTLDAEERMDDHTERIARSVSDLRWLVAVIVCVVASAIAVAVWLRGRHVPKPTARAERLRRNSSAWRHHLESGEAFMKTPVYAEVAELERQPADRHARVLSHSRQEALDGELARVFHRFIAELRTECPSLTDGDVKLCCLSLVPLSSFGRALCFGSTETNIIKQRKHKIKRKMDTREDAHSLFEFIFAPRD